MYEQQHPHHHHQPQMRTGMKKNIGNNNSRLGGVSGGGGAAAERRKGAIEEEKLEIVDLSGMSLECLPNPSLNLATICKLDLSNNNLQVYYIYIYIHIMTILIYMSLFLSGFLNRERESHTIKVINFVLGVRYLADACRLCTCISQSTRILKVVFLSVFLHFLSYPNGFSSLVETDRYTTSLAN